MKKKITSIFFLTALITLFFVNIVISDRSAITKTNTLLNLQSSIATANAECPDFDPTQIYCIWTGYECYMMRACDITCYGGC